MKSKTAAVIYILVLPVLAVSLLIGPADVPLSAIIASAFSGESSLAGRILFDIRIPRVLLTFLTGSALVVSGASMQSVFRNPLVSPYILGLSSGAAFGAALSFAVPFIPVQVSAFIFGFSAVLISVIIAKKNKQLSAVSLILSGIIVTGIFTALLTVIQFLSDPFKLQGIIHWQMGNLHNANIDKLSSAAIPILAGCFVLWLYRWRLNTLAMGDDEALTSGLNPEREKMIILLFSTLAASAAVAAAGVIALYGLIIPHIVRMITGPDNRKAIPLNFFLGGVFLVIIDDFSRAAFSFEIPIGVFTMLLGAPFFIYLMKRYNVGWKK